MEPLKELSLTLNQGEHKMITQRLVNSGKNQLETIYIQLQNSEDFYVKGKSRQDILTLKNQLYLFILNVLSEHQLNRTKDIEFRDELNKIEVLKNRFLFKSALKRINKLKVKLIEHERFTYLQELLLTESEINSILLSEKEFEIYSNELTNEFQLFNRENQNYFLEKTAFFKTFGTIHNSDQEGQLTPKFKSFTETGNRSAHFYNSRSKLIFQIQNKLYLEAEITAKELKELLVVHDHEFESLPFQKLDVTYMSAIAFLLVNNVEDVKKCMTEMEQLEDDYPMLSQKKLERSLFLRTIELNMFPNKTTLEKKVIDQVNDRPNDLGSDFMMRIREQLANYFIKKEDYVTSNKWNRKILETGINKRKKHFYYRAELRNLFIHHKRGRIETFESNFDRLVRNNHISKTMALEEMESIFNFWKKIN
jgi:hypothetical protein